VTKPTGTSAEILNLPSGGGSVSGPGSAFNVDLNTGTGTCGFALVLPAGPNGITPAISLGYATTSGNGPFGMGWSLALAVIARTITPAAGQRDPASIGTYSLVGVGDLVDMGDGQFRPVVDTLGQLIEYGDGAWSLTDSHDTVLTLGTTPSAQIGSDPPAAWLLDSCTDSSGNKISYTWTDDGGTPIPGTVSWGTYELIFGYEDRPDLIIDGQYGAPITLSKRCGSIELHVTTEDQSLVRSWLLRYDDDSGRGRSMLSAIREQGHANDGSVLAAPDRTFAYTAAQAPAFSEVSGWTADLDDPDTDFVDLNGDGLPDILQLGDGLPAMHPNQGLGEFGYPRAFRRTPAPLSLGSADVAFADMSGEGNADLLVLSQTLSGYYPLSVPQDGSAPSRFGFPVTFSNSPAITPGDPRVRLLDLNGDGITDVLFDTGRAWLEFFREDASSWSGTPRVLPSGVTPPVDLTDAHVYLAYMTGDGITDIVRVDGGGVSYWPGRADGGWAAEISMTPSPTFDRRYDPARMYLIDIDGDGCADLVYVGPDSVTVWRNVGAAQLAGPMVVEHTPLTQSGTYRLLDLFGSGTPGVLFQVPTLRPGVTRQVFLDLCGGAKPYLLSSFTNGLGLSTRITYRTSTSYAIQDAAAGSPWNTYHPFPVQCAARTDQTDEASGVTVSTVYSYHGGRYDPATRTFLGFSAVECDQIGDQTCPTLRTQTTFHVGLDPADPGKPLYGDDALIQGALRRRVLSTTTYGLDGTDLEAKPYSVASHSYTALLVPSGLNNGNQVAVPYMTNTTEQRWERNDAPVSTRIVDILNVDQYGAILSQRTRAQRSGVATPDQDITTTTTFASGGRNLRLPARVTQTGADGSVVGITVTYYDGPAFTGLPEGQATQGLTTRVEALAFTGEFATAVWGDDPPDLTAYGYHRLPGDDSGWWITRRSLERTTNATGPQLGSKGSLGALQQVQIDASGQFVVAVTDVMGNTISGVPNQRIWQTESLTDANANTTTDVFDALGRVTATIGPLDSQALPACTFSVTTGTVSEISAAARINHGESQTLPASTWLDSSGRSIGRSAPGPSAPQWVMAGAVAYNTRGFQIAAYLPYEVSAGQWQAPPAGASATLTAYDALGRVAQITRPDGLVITTRRDGRTVTFSEQWPGAPQTDVEQQEFDAAGQLIAVSRNAGDHWIQQSYTYDRNGKLAQVTLPDAAQVTLQNDLLGRRFSHQSADTGRTVYLVDACGNVRIRTNATGQQLRTDVDAMNRMTAIYYDGEADPRISYAYLDHGDPAPPDGITANRYARLWQVSDELGTVVFQYNETGKVTVSQRTIAASSGTYVTRATYDALGRVTSSTLPTGVSGGTARTVEYSYGVDGRVATASGVVTEASYDLLGRITSLTYANGASTTLGYDPDGGGLARVRVTGSSAELLRDTQVSRTDAFITALASAVPADDTVSLSYDGMRRLVAADYSSGATALDTHSWAYDDSFAPTLSSDIGPITYKAGTHQIASAGGQATTYDNAGRTIAARYGSLTFDAADHLTSISPPGADPITHAYDYRGRLARSVSGTTQTYLSPGIGIEIQGQTAVAWIGFGQLRVAGDVNGTLWFMHPNALGDMDLITDAAGAYSTRLRQTPFNLTRPLTTEPAGTPAALAALMTGADSTGLICRGQRWYDPAVCQFISPDPMISGLYLVGAWNPYVYCLGNPVALSDPSGCSILGMLGVALIATVAVLGAVFGGGIAVLGLTTMLEIPTATAVSATVGTFGGALVGESAAQRAGGNIWAGAFVGALLGGLSTVAGGALGSSVAASVNDAALPAQLAAPGGLVYPTFGSFVASGLWQGMIAGAGTGIAIGFAGGKGNADAIFKALTQGVFWGAALGTLLGAGIGGIVGGDNPDKFINILNMEGKFDNRSTALAFAKSLDNGADVPESLMALAPPGGMNAGNVFGVITNFVGTDSTAGGVLSLEIPKQVASIVLSSGPIAAAVTASMASDQLGFSYTQITVLLLGAAPFVDFAIGALQLFDSTNTANAETAINNALGSASPPVTGTGWDIP
jgi:RHS repeat-associated protein